MPIVPFFPQGGSTPAPSPVGGGTWLNIPATVYVVQATPSPNPAPYTFPEPTNGTGPYTYELALVTSGTSTGAQGSMVNWNPATRTIFSTVGADTNSLGERNLLIRIRATDSIGNYGYGYVLFLRNSGVDQANHIVLPELVLDETDPALTGFTFPLAVVGAIPSTNLNVQPYGTGLISPQPMTTDPSGRIQGPYTVDPVPGGTIFLTTGQQTGSGSSSSTRYILVKPVRRRRADSFPGVAPAKMLWDLDLKAIGAADPSAFTTPLTTTVQFYEADYVPAPGQLDYVNVRTNAVNVGIAPTAETSELAANGMVLSTATVSSSGRSIRQTIEWQFYPSNTPLAQRNPNRLFLVQGDAEIVSRMMGKVDFSTGPGRINWSNGHFSTQLLVSWVKTTTVAPPTLAAADVVQLALSRGLGANPSLLGFVPQADVNGQYFGMDSWRSGVRGVVVVYRWGGAWPDLDDDQPYAGLQHWVSEYEVDSAGASSFAYGTGSATGAPFNSASGNQAIFAAGSSFLVHECGPNSNPNATVTSTIERAQVAVRIRDILPKG